MSVTLFISCFKIISGDPKWLQSLGEGGGGGFKCMTRTETKNFFDLEIFGKYTFGELDLNQVAFMVHSKQFEDSLLFPRMSRIQAA